jgi:hypothetical protein
MARQRPTLKISISSLSWTFSFRVVCNGKASNGEGRGRAQLRLLGRQDWDWDDMFPELKARLQRGAEQAERGELRDGDAGLKSCAG